MARGVLLLLLLRLVVALGEGSHCPSAVVVRRRALTAAAGRQGHLGGLVEAGKRRAESLRRSQIERKRAREDEPKGTS